jgi:hypothetical protein
MNIDNLDTDEIFELLEACDEFDFNELIEDLQNHLIIEKKEWIQQNLINLHKISSKHQSFNLLHDYFDELIYYYPELFLKSNDIKDIEKATLMFILKSNYLKLNEIDIWDYVIQWGIGQKKELEEDISVWNKEKFIILRNVLKDIIPLIRFKQIFSIDFNNKIKPFKKAFEKEVYEEILEYYLVHNRQPTLLVQQGPRVVKETLLNLKKKRLISSWIDKTKNLYNINNLPYEFELILSGTQDGFSRSVFEEKCYNIKQTVAIMKIQKTGELVGGYNPVYWNIKEKPLGGEYCIETDESFIFKIDENQINNSILSRVKNPECAIMHSEKKFEITLHNKKYYEDTINFYNLALANSIYNKPHCLYNFDDGSYEKDLKLLKVSQLVEELEVFKLVN